MRRLWLVITAAFAVLSLVPIPASAADPAEQVWSLSADFTANARGAHGASFPDSLGNPGVWQLLAAPSAERRSAGYRLLSSFRAPACEGGPAALIAWDNNGANPGALANIGATRIEGTPCAPYQKILPGHLRHDRLRHHRLAQPRRFGRAPGGRGRRPTAAPATASTGSSPSAIRCSTRAALAAVAPPD